MAAGLLVDRQRHDIGHRAPGGGTNGAPEGRVGSVNTVGVFGGLVIGSGVGGTLAQRFGATAPFSFAFAGSVLCVVLIWGQLTHIAHDDEPREPLIGGG